MGISSALGSDALLPGLVLVKSQTIGSAVSSVTVSDCFSSTYDNYRIIINGGSASTATALTMQLGPSSVSGYNSGYYSAQAYTIYTADGITYIRDNNASTWSTAGGGYTQGLFLDAMIYNPFIASLRTGWALISRIDPRTDGAAVYGGGGFHNTAASFSGFTIATNTGTMTGGTIRVYGMRN